MGRSDKNNTSGSKSTTSPPEKLDKSVRPASGDNVVQNKHVPSSSLSKRIQPASTAAAAAPLNDPLIVPPVPSECQKQSAPPASQQTRETEKPSGSTGATETPSIKLSPESEKPKESATSGSPSQCNKPQPVCKGGGGRPVCKDTRTVLKPPPKRPSLKSIALTAVAVIGGVYLYETVVKDYIFGGPECACGCNKDKK